ncbi:MAG TPA: AraC family transcriptional regulator [Chthonomonadaceae bacterium]|nr:AraC family transcriptional regulator [Chthonomonadaceae bacterium]
MNEEARREAVTEREAQRTQANREELVERIAQAVPEDGVVEPMKGLFLRRSSAPTKPVHGVAAPAFCVIAQGNKEIVVGETRYRYDPAHYLLNTVELPVVSQVVEASREQPYLSLRFNLDPVLVGSVLVEAGQPTPRGNADVRAINVSALDAGLLDATVRLVRLLDVPEEARVLAPLVTREIVFRLLMGEQGGRLRHLVAQGGYADRIARAVERIRNDFDKPLRIDDLARELGMSASGLHHQFKAVTALTPLQFQKQLRLQEARRLMLGEDLDAASAGYRVGYDDAAHFNREYKRLFGMPPMRDVGRLREAARASAGP